MIALNLQTKSREQELVKSYLQENVSQVLADKINNGVPTEKDGKPLISRKNLDGFFSFATEEARKLATKSARSACIEDKTVFGWAIHYFEEDSILGTLYYMDGAEYKPAPKPKSTTKTTTAPIALPKLQPKTQFSLFDMLAEKTDDSIETDDTETDDDYPSEEEMQEALKEIAEEEAEIENKPLPKEQPKGSPLYQKYVELQNKYPTSVIAMRLGDFYEVFGDNATAIANELDLTLTGRDCGLDSRVPMVGFPYHAAEVYFGKISKTHSVVVVENSDKIKQIPLKVAEQVQTVDIETGEILSEEEMREFDGDIYEPKDVPDDLQNEHEIAKAFDKQALSKLSELLGEIFIVR